MNRLILRKIAKENGVSVEDVRREMQLTIEAAYISPNATALSVPRKSEIPTPEEFIEYIAHRCKGRR